MYPRVEEGPKREIEVKFYVSSFDGLRKRIMKIKPSLQPTGKEFEINLRFDDLQSSLKLKGEVLRLRRSGMKTTLTFKGQLKANLEFKERIELEVEVDDFQEAKQILENLGFHEYTRYEKRREKFHNDKLEICFDEMPYGNFVEIEGSKRSIRETVKKLGFEWKNRIVDDYIRIFEDLCEEKDLNSSDLTFENFKKIDAKVLSFKEFIRRFYAGT